MHHVDTVERGFGGLVSAEAERVVGDRDVEVFGHLALAEYGGERLADGRCSTQRVVCSQHPGANARQILFGGRQQFVALTGTFLPQQRVPAHYQAFTPQPYIAIILIVI